MTVEDKFKNAVLTEDGELEKFILRVDGKLFRCRCGSNCFHKPDSTKLDIYECNSCGVRFLGKIKDMQ
ncbi:DNA ligase [Salmonella phage GSP193]|uniref:DNA ligase n=1 Tax=Salmonella phage GSP193 TaxID=2962601 RepID=A0AAX3C1I4_9CAUD|nr:DNA ligase [Salmonella phage GSP193]